MFWGLYVLNPVVKEKEVIGKENKKTPCVMCTSKKKQKIMSKGRLELPTFGLDIPVVGSTESYKYETNALTN